MNSLLDKPGVLMVQCSRRANMSPGTHNQSAVISAPRASLLVPRRVHKLIWIGERSVPVVLCRAEPGQQLTVVDLISLLSRASSAWEKYDKDRNGTMCLEECENIFNSQEITDAFEALTSMPHRHYTAADLAPYFKRADKDASGTLSRTEFLALYLAIAGDRVKRNPLLLAEALLGFLDKDKNGVLEGNELKQLLVILGFAPALLLPIPGFMKIEYRAILKRIGRVMEGVRKQDKA